MIRTLLLAASAALTLAACNQAPAPQASEAPVQNAPSQQAFQMPASQASLSADDRAQLEQLVRGYLDNAQNVLAQGMRPAPGLADQITSLQPGRDHRWQVQLTGGTAYRIIGGCDNECSNLDIELIDARGGVVASDMAPDDAPVVNFTPSANGAYSVRLLMQTCTVAPCYAGARVLVN